MAVTSFGSNVQMETAYGQIMNTSEAVEVANASANVMDTERIVREYFSDIPVMIQVARCESTFRHTLEDGSVLKGRVDNADTGVMQINKRYHEKTATAMGLNLDDIYHNMAYARHLYETQGTQPWSASAPCWNSTLAMNI
jgi:hypothetical protein